MGIRETLITNFEDKTLEYLGKKFYVIKQFDYKGKTYLYALDLETLGTNDLGYAFLYRVDDDIFNHVRDEETCNDLFDIVSGLCVEEIVNKNLQDMIDYKIKKV